jgi:hypothetical protein
VSASNARAAAVGAGLANWYVPAGIPLAALIVLGMAAIARRVLG